MAPQAFNVIIRNIRNLGSDSSKRIKARRNAVDEEVAKRRAIVASNTGMTARELCEMFDRKQVTLPTQWKDAGIESWTRAYQLKKYRGRVQTMISKDRRK